jgi:hypothetical protein
MRNALCKTIAVAGLATAAFVGVSAPSFAATVPAGGNNAPQQLTLVPGGNGSDGAQCVKGSPACEVRTSVTTRNEQNMFNFGGAELGGGAANLVSSAIGGLASFALDLVQSFGHIFGL